VTCEGSRPTLQPPLLPGLPRPLLAARPEPPVPLAPAEVLAPPPPPLLLELLDELLPEPLLELDEKPLDEKPLDEKPLDEKPLDEKPLDELLLELADMTALPSTSWRAAPTRAVLPLDATAPPK